MACLVSKISQLHRPSYCFFANSSAQNVYPSFFFFFFLIELRFESSLFLCFSQFSSKSLKLISRGAMCLQSPTAVRWGSLHLAVGAIADLFLMSSQCPRTSVLVLHYQSFFVIQAICLTFILMPDLAESLPACAVISMIFFFPLFVDSSNYTGLHASLWTVNLVLLTKSFLFLAVFHKLLGNLSQ